MRRRRPSDRAACVAKSGRLSQRSTNAATPVAFDVRGEEVVGRAARRPLPRVRYAGRRAFQHETPDGSRFTDRQRQGDPGPERVADDSGRAAGHTPEDLAEIARLTLYRVARRVCRLRPNAVAQQVDLDRGRYAPEIPQMRTPDRAPTREAVE